MAIPRGKMCRLHLEGVSIGESKVDFLWTNAQPFTLHVLNVVYSSLTVRGRLLGKLSEISQGLSYIMNNYSRR